MPGPRNGKRQYLVHRLMNRAKEVHLLHRGALDKKTAANLPDTSCNSKGRPQARRHAVPRGEPRGAQLPLPDARPDIPGSKSVKGCVVVWANGLGRHVPQRHQHPSPMSALRLPLPLSDGSYRAQTAMEASTLGSVVHWVMEHGLAEAEGHVLQTHHLERCARGSMACLNKHWKVNTMRRL